jgi:hypothetical protein
MWIPKLIRIKNNEVERLVETWHEKGSLELHSVALDCNGQVRPLSCAIRRRSTKRPKLIGG